LNFFLRFPDKEISDGLWNRILHVSQDNIEVVVNPDSQLIDEHIATGLLLVISHDTTVVLETSIVGE